MSEKDKSLLESLKKTIRKEEGLRLKAYKPDQREEHYTIGYGRYNKDIKKGSKITEKEAEKMLDEDIKTRLKKIRKKIKNYDQYSDSAKQALFSSWYRGSLSGSPKTIKLLNEGKHEEASKEFLNNAEYRRRLKEGNMPGVIKRMEKTSQEIKNISPSKQEREFTPVPENTNYRNVAGAKSMSEEEKRRLKRFMSAHPSGKYPKNVTSLSVKEKKGKPHPLVSTIDPGPQYEVVGEKQLSPTALASEPLDLSRPSNKEEKPLLADVDNIVDSVRKDIKNNESSKIAKAQGKEIIKALPKEEVESLVKDAAKEANISKKDTKKALKEVKDIKKGEEKSSVKSQFTDALTYFLPSIIGGIGGALFEGTEGAIAGAETAQGLYQGYLDEDFRRQGLVAGSYDKPFQQSDAIDKDTGAPIVFDPNEGIYRSAAGEKVPPQNVVSGKQARFEGRMDFNVAKEAQFSGKQQEVQSGYDEVTAGLDSIKTLTAEQDPVTGVVTGRFYSLAELAGAAPERFTRLKSETVNMVSSFLKSRSGATVSDREREFLEGMMANVNVHPKVFETRVNQFEEIVVRNQRQQLLSIVDTQPMKREVALRKLDMLNKKYPQDKVIQNKIGPENPGAKNPSPTTKNINALKEEARVEKDPRKRLEMLREIKRLNEGQQ